MLIGRRQGTDSRASGKEALCFREWTLLGTSRSGSAGRRGEVPWEMMRHGAGEGGRSQVKRDHRTQGKRWEPLKDFNQGNDLWMI